MSLLAVNSYEQFSPDLGSSIDSTLRGRRLSFNPLPASWDVPLPPLDTIPVIGAFEIPKAKRVAQVAIAVTYCLLAAGIVFGYAAIKPVLIREHVYRYLCKDDDPDPDVRTCFDQEIHLNLMFTIAAVGTNVAALPIGAILDHYGPRVCGIIGSFLIAIGATLFAYAYQMPFDTYIPGYLFLALGGPFIYISSFQLSNAFPKNSGLILALITGAFDTSSALFLIYRLLYQWSDGKFYPKYFFLGYLIVPLLILIVQIFIMPKHSYETVGELVAHIEDDDESPFDDQEDETTALLRAEHRNRQASIASTIHELLGSKRGIKQIKQEDRKKQISGVWGVLHGKTVREQILSPWFVLITLFTVVQMTRINFFVATIRSQYEYLLGSYEDAVMVNNFFDVALPLGGVCSIPFIGLVLDNTSTVIVLATLVSIATTIGILGMLPYTWAAYTNIVLFTLYRPFYYTTVSDYSAKVFGFRTFGTVYGLIICLAGLGNFSQSGLDILIKMCGGNPVPVNIGLLTVALLVGGSLVTFVGVSAYKMRRANLEDEAEDAEETTMPRS